MILPVLWSVRSLSVCATTTMDSLNTIQHFLDFTHKPVHAAAVTRQDDDETEEVKKKQLVHKECTTTVPTTDDRWIGPSALPRGFFVIRQQRRLASFIPLGSFYRYSFFPSPNFFSIDTSRERKRRKFRTETTGGTQRTIINNSETRQVLHIVRTARVLVLCWMVLDAVGTAVLLRAL